MARDYYDESKNKNPWSKKKKKNNQETSQKKTSSPSVSRKVTSSTYGGSTTGSNYATGIRRTTSSGGGSNSGRNTGSTTSSTPQSSTPQPTYSQRRYQQTGSNYGKSQRQMHSGGVISEQQRRNEPVTSNRRNTPVTSTSRQRNGVATTSREMMEQRKAEQEAQRKRTSTPADENRAFMQRQKSGILTAEDQRKVQEKTEHRREVLGNTGAAAKKGLYDAGSGYVQGIEDFSEMTASNKNVTKALSMKMGYDSEKDKDKIAELERDRQRTAEQARAHRLALSEKQQKRQEEFDKRTKNATEFEKALYGATESGAGMLADIGIGAITGTGQAGALSSMFLRTYGSTRGQAEREGATENEDRLYAALQGLKEVGTELMFPGAGLAKGYVGKAGLPLADKIAVNLTKNMGKRAGNLTGAGIRLFGGAVEENAEEGAGWLLDPWIKEMAYGRNVRKRTIQDELKRESDDLRMNIKSEEDAAYAATYLGSEDFMAQTVQQCMDAGLSEQKATEVASQMRDYLSASLSGDTEAMESIQDDLARTLSGKSLKDYISDLDMDELKETIASTSLLTLTTGLPGTISTTMRGAMVRDKLGDEGIKALANSATNFEDAVASARGKVAKETMDEGGNITDTQIMDLVQAQSEQVQKDTGRMEAKEQAADKRIKANGNVSPVLVRNRDGSVQGDEVITREFKKSEAEASEIIKSITSSKESESLSDTEVRDGAQAIAAFETGDFNIKDANELNFSNTAIRTAFEQKTGVDLSQYIVRDRRGDIDIPATNAATKDALFAMAADNLVRTSELETQNWMDKVKGETVAQITQRMGGQGSLALQAALDNYDERDRSTYLRTAMAADTIYQTGLNMDTDWENVRSDAVKAFRGVDENLLKDMYTAGRMDRMISESNTIGRSVKIGEKLSEMGEQNNVRGQVVVETAVPPKGTMIRTFSEIANNLNVEIHLVDDIVDKDGKVLKGANGTYKNGVIYLNVTNGVESNVGYIFMHEVTHHIKEYAPEQYKELENLVRDRWFRFNPDQMQDEIGKTIDLYKRVANQTLTEEEALEEIIADACHEFINDPDFAREVADEDPGLAKAMLNSIKSALRMLRQVLATGSIEQTHMKSLFSYLDILDEAERLWLNAYTEAARNKAAVGLIEWQDEANKHSVGEPRSASARYEQGYKLTQNQFRSYYSAHKLNLRNQDNLDEQLADIRENGFRSTTALSNVMPVSTNDTIDPDHMNIMQGRYGVREGETVLLVPKDYVDKDDRIKDGFVPRDYEVVTAERDYQPYYELYSKAYDETQTRFSIPATDSDGNTLSEAQREFFKDSKVRDDNGNLQVMYHGSGAEFFEFDRNKIGRHGSFEGAGFNFTPSEGRAKGYSRIVQEGTEWKADGGFVLEGYLNIRNPLSATEKTFTARSLAEVIRKIDPTGDDVISNYARDTSDYGTDAFVRREALYTARQMLNYHDSDVDIYSDLSASGSNSNAIIEAFKDMGYDGLIHYDDTTGKIVTCIAFDSEQFKNIDNLTPTESPDIRYSITPQQAEIIEHEVGPDIRFSVRTDNVALPKAVYKGATGYHDFEGLVASGRELRKALNEKNFSPEQAEAVDDFMTLMGAYFMETGEGSLRYKYRFIGWDDLTEGTVQVKKDRDGNITGVVVSAMVKNGEYPVNFDLTTICNKREGITDVIRNLMETEAEGDSVLNTIKLSDKNMWKINEALKAENIDTACLGCFVEARRYYAQRFMDKIEDKWNTAVRDARRQLGLPEDEYFDFAKGRAVTGEEWSSIDDLWTKYDKSTESKSSPADRIKILMDEIVREKDVNSPYLKQIRIADILTPEGINGFKQLSNKGHDMVKTIKSIYGTSAPKEILAFTPYNSEIALLPDTMKGMDTADYLRSIGGIRVQSFSDFKIEHLYEHMQMVADEAARGFVTHGYTKVIAFAKLFGMTGRKINMSVMFDVLPNRAWSEALGIPVKKAAKYAKKYQGLQFVKEKPAKNPDNRPYQEVTIEGVHGYLTYLVSDADYVNSVFETEYQKNLDAGMDEAEARRQANKAKPYEQSINYREAVDLQNKDGYKENVGIIAVAYGDEHLKMLLSDPNVRYIIPYHKSGLPTFISKKTSLAIARDYTNFQNTNLVDQWKDSNGRVIDFQEEYKAFKKESKSKYPAIEFFKQINDNKYKVKFKSKDSAQKAEMAGTADFDVYAPLETAKEVQEVSNAYLEHCIEKGWCPVFHEFAGDPNYYKMIFDFSVVDGEGNIHPQREVRNNYPGLDIDAKVAAGEKITDEDLAEFKKVIDECADEQDKKNMTRSLNMGNVMNDILTRGSDNSIIDDTNLQSIRWGTPDYTDVKLGNEEMTPEETPADIKLSISVNYDEDYMDAVNSGNMDEAQRLVDEAAKMAGYGVRAYHGTSNYGFTEFQDVGIANGRAFGDGFYFTDVRDASKRFALQQWKKDETSGEYVEDGTPGIYNVFLNPSDDALEFDWDNYTYNGRKVKGPGLRTMIQTDIEAQPEKDVIIHNINDGSQHTSTVYVIKDAGRIKSADTITYAEDGSVIPLSERFDPENDDIRYSLPTQDSDGNILTDGQMEYFKNSQARDEQGRLVPVYHATEKAGGFTIFDPQKSDDKRSLFFSSNVDVAKTYAKHGDDRFYPYGYLITQQYEVRKYIEDYGPDVVILDKEEFEQAGGWEADILDLWKAQESRFKDIRSGVELYDLYVDKAEKEGYMIAVTVPNYDKDANSELEGRWQIAESSKDLINILRDDFNWQSYNYKNQAGYYACYLNLENPMIIEANGQNWDAISIGEDKASSASKSINSIKLQWERDEDNNPISVTVEFNIGFKDEDPWTGGMSWYSNDFEETFEVDEDELSYYDSAEKYLGEQLYNYWDEYGINQDVLTDLIENYADEDGDMNMNFGNDPIYLDSMGEEIIFDEDEDEYSGTHNTRGWAAIAQAEGYDGVIFRNLYDHGGKSGWREISDIYIAFDSRQIKDVNNENPSENPDIRYSVADDDSTMNYMQSKAESTDELWSNDPVIAEGRVRYSMTKKDFINASAKMYDDKWQREYRPETLDISENNIRKVIMAAMESSDTNARYRQNTVRRTIERAKIAYNYLHNNDPSKAAEVLFDHSMYIVENLEFFVEDENFERWKELKKYLRNHKMTVDIEDRQPDYSLFRQSNFGKILLVNEGGINPTEAWAELNKIWPDVFTKEIKNDPNAILKQAEYALEILKPLSQAYTSEECMDLASNIAQDILDIIYEGDNWHMSDDSYGEKTALMKERHGEATRVVQRSIHNMRKQYTGKIKSIKQKNANKDEQKKYRLKHRQLYNRVLNEYNTLTDMLLKPSHKDRTKNIPEQLRQPVAEMLAVFDLEKERSKKLEEKYRIPTRTQLDFRQIKDALEKVAKEEGQSTEFETYFNYINGKITDIADKMDKMNTHTIDALSNEDIEVIKDMLAGLIESVKNWHQLEIDGQNYQAQQICDKVGEGADEHQSLYGKSKKYGSLIGFLDNIVNMGELTPIYFFRQLKGMYDMYRQIRRGFDDYVRNNKMIMDRLSEIMSDYYKKNRKGQRVYGSEVEEWRHSETAETFNLTYGSITLTVAQRMSLYCLAKREQAKGHMYSDNGGVVASEITAGSKIHKAEEALKGKTIEYKQLQLTPADIDNIITSLTPEQIHIADELQKLMSDDMSELGNKTSMKMLGIKLYKETEYFPIKIQGESKGKDLDNISVREKVRNPGFSNPLKENATNPIIIDDIFTVVAKHCNEMNLYASYAVPLTNFMKVYNGSVMDEKSGKAVKIQTIIKETYGEKAIDYIDNFLDDINGNSFKRHGGLNDVLDKALGQAKKAAVFANLRVALQQPTAIVRAFAVMKVKYFKGVKPSAKETQEMIEHCPIAMWKSLGYYDTHFGRDIEDVMMGKDVPSKMDKYMSEIYGALDNMTWGMIWQAVKNEIKETRKDLEVGSPEFFEACSERASYVFDSTQVVDSPFHRSNDMRSKDTFQKQLTSFQAEPTLSFNVLRQGIMDAREAAKKGDTKKAADAISRIALVWVGQAFTVAVAQSLVDALRRKGHKDGDDDEDQAMMWYEVMMKYFTQNFVDNFSDDVNPINNIYWFKDFVPGIVNVLKGEYVYGQQNLAYQWFDSLTKGIQAVKKKWEKGDSYKKSWYDCFTELMGGIGYMCGFPAKTVMRGTKNAFYWFNKISGANVFADDGTVKSESVIDSVLLKMGYRKKDSDGESSGKSSKAADKEKAAEEKKAESKAVKKLLKTGIKQGEKAIPKTEEQLLSEIEEKTVGYFGEDRDRRIWDIVSDGYTDYIENGDYSQINKIRNVIEKAGGNVQSFDNKVLKASKSAYKKMMVDDPTEDQIQAQQDVRNYLLEHGMTEAEISAEICYKSDTARDLKAAFRMGNEDYIVDELVTLLRAGITRDDIYKLYKYRNYGAKDYDGKYTQPEYRTSQGSYIWPTQGTITSHFGYRDAPTAGASSNHQAIDIGAPQGTPVVAADGGVVIEAGSNGGYGNSVGIRHDDGTISYYNHLYTWGVKVGDKVSQGQQIGQVGSTGISTGPHLDFRLYKDGEYLDPEQYLQ